MNTSPGTRKVVSIGYEQRDLAELIELLRSVDVDVLVDVRLNAISRKPGFSKSALGAGLEQAGISYRHKRTLGNPKENRAALRRGDPEARNTFLSHLREDGAADLEAIRELAERSTIALLCYERDHGSCHRASIIDEVWSEDPSVSVIKA